MSYLMGSLGLSRRAEGLIQISNDVIDVLDADADPNNFSQDACVELLIG